jgi:hypothetical protein
MSIAAGQEEILTGVFSDPAELSDWVQRNVPADPTAYIIAERVPQEWLDDSARSNGLRFVRRSGEFEAGEFEAGYLFSMEFEVRWERVPKGIHARYIGRPVNEPKPLVQSTDQLVGELETPETQYQLWGRRVGINDLTLIGGQVTDGAFFASARIPRLLQYPASDNAEIMYLCVREYRDRQSGRTLLWRFTGVMEKP